MSTLLFQHEDFGLHETPQGHPEQRARYRVVERALATPDFEALQRRVAEEASWQAIGLAHPQMYCNVVRTVAPVGETMLQLDPDTWMGRHTLGAVRRAAGAGVAAGTAVLAGEARNAFVVARPPGHHAEAEKAMGFCVFNTAAITALQAQVALGGARVAVLDFDVHHGNGTQAIFWDRPDCFYGSSHEWPQYPGTGKREERGAFGQICNQPLARGSDGSVFRRAWGEVILPALADFGPDFIVISAGFDGHEADPLGGLALCEEDFAWLTDEILAVARDQCAGRLVSVLEGGYDLPALAKSVAVHVKSLASL